MMETADSDWRSDLAAIIGRLRDVYEERFDSMQQFSAFLREEGVEPASERTLYDYLNPSAEKAKPDTEWLLKVADALGIDYQELFRGSRSGWDRAPRERYRIVLPENQGRIEFHVPRGWREHLDLTFSGFPLGRDVNMRVEQVESDESAA